MTVTAKRPDGGRPDAPRDGKGRYLRTQEGADRRERIVRMRTEGRTVEEIARTEGISGAAVSQAFAEAMELGSRLAVAEAEERERIDFARMEEDERILRERGHNPPPVVTPSGKVVRDVPDIDKATRALDAANRIRAERGKRDERRRATAGRRVSRDEEREWDDKIRALLFETALRAQLSAIEAGTITVSAPDGYVAAIEMRRYARMPSEGPCETDCAFCRGDLGAGFCGECYHCTEMALAQEQERTDSGIVEAEIVEELERVPAGTVGYS